MSETETLTQEEGTQEGVTGGFNLTSVLATPALTLPKQTSEVHTGTVVAVTTFTSDSGTTFGKIAVKSDQTGLVYDEFAFFPPEEWFDGGNWEDGVFNTKVLSQESLGLNAKGNPKASPAQNYAINVFAQDAAFNQQTQEVITEVVGKEAPLQLLAKLAGEAGLTVDANPPQNGEEYIAVINELVAGKLEVLFTRNPQKSDNPSFDGRLKVNRILSKGEIDKPSFAKRFKNSRILFQE